MPMNHNLFSALLATDSYNREFLEQYPKIFPALSAVSAKDGCQLGIVSPNPKNARPNLHRPPPNKRAIPNFTVSIQGHSRTMTKTLQPGEQGRRHVPRIIHSRGADICWTVCAVFPSLWGWARQYRFSTTRACSGIGGSAGMQTLDARPWPTSTQRSSYSGDTARRQRFRMGRAEPSASLDRNPCKPVSGFARRMELSATRRTVRHHSPDSGASAP